MNKMSNQKRKGEQDMKEQLITRTIVTTKVTVLGVNATIGETENRTYFVPGAITDQAKALKMAIKQNTEPEFVPALVVDLAQDEKVYGLEVSKFIELAHEVERPASQQKKAN
jgi:hypothetical protein